MTQLRQMLTLYDLRRRLHIDRQAVAWDEAGMLPLRAGIPVIDFERRLRDIGDPLGYFPFRVPNHYTAEGYLLLTEQIWNAVYRGRGRARSLPNASSLAIPGAREGSLQGS